jgi:hypothetical protein
MRIVAAAIMSDPLIVLGVNVRDIRMTLPVHGNVVLRRGTVLLTSRRIGSPRGSGTMRGNVTAANRGVTAAARCAPASSILRKSSQANQNR